MNGGWSVKRVLGVEQTLMGAVVATVLTACSGGGAQHLLPADPAARAVSPNTTAVAPPGWAATATRGALVVGGADAGPLAPSAPVTVRVGLSLRNRDTLQSLIAARRKVTPAEFAARFAPARSDVQAVVEYLGAQGFRNVKAAGLLVSGDGTAAQASKAFNTTLESFKLGGTTLYANTTPAFVPAGLRGAVSAVLGLNDAARMKTRAATAQLACFQGVSLPTGQCAPLFDAASVQQFYDAGVTADGSQTSVAVMAAGDMTQVVADLRYAENQQGLPQVPLTLVTVGAASADQSNSVEWDLDTQSSTGMAQNVGALYLYATTSLSDADITNEYNAWAHGAGAVASTSFGECESQAFLDGSMSVDDDLLMTAAAYGKTMFVSTGDTGSACTLTANGQAGPPEVEYPAASPYAVAVGGTTAVANAADGSYAGESAWSGGGGGVSKYETAASWQQGVAPAGAGAVVNPRGLPDIAMAADPNSGSYRVYGTNIPGAGDCSNGCAIGGTSEAAPLGMGAYARILSAHVNEIGYANPLLYAEYRQQQGGAQAVTGPPPTRKLGGFHDILVGSNGAYTAGPGYDYTTGLGSIDISIMNAQIAN